MSQGSWVSAYEDARNLRSPMLEPFPDMLSAGSSYYTFYCIGITSPLLFTFFSTFHTHTHTQIQMNHKCTYWRSHLNSVEMKAIVQSSNLKAKSDF